MSKRAWAFIVVALIFAGLASCSSDRVVGKLAEGCVINSDCTSPLVCAFSRCHTECAASRDCPKGQHCVASDRPYLVCQLADESTCETNAECYPGMVCGIDRLCRDHCATNLDCIAGQTCTAGTCADPVDLVDGGLRAPPGAGGGASANRPCTYSSDCPEPLVCLGGACVIECKVDRDCPYFATCTDGRCRLPGVLGGGGGAGAGGATSLNPDASVGGTTGAGGSSGGGGTGGAGGSSGSGGGISVGGAPPAQFPDCVNRDTASATKVSGDITTNQTWSGLINVTSYLYISNGATVTINPGTTIIVNTGASIDFGYNSSSATILANGTPAAPISFCGQVSDAGTWSYLRLESKVTSSSVLSNVLIEDAGDTGAALRLDTGVKVDNVQVRNAQGIGVSATDFKTGSAQLSVDSVGGVPVSLAGSGAVTRFPLGGALTGNGTELVQLAFSDIQEDIVFHDVGLPYLATGDMYVEAGKTTFEAGVEVQFGGAYYFNVGYNGASASLSVDGTASNPVTFRGQNTDPGSWDGFVVGSTVASSSHIAHAHFQHAGAEGYYALALKSPITVNDVTVDTSLLGVRVESGGLGATSTNLTVTGIQGVPLSLPPDALGSIPKGGTFTGNATDQIQVDQAEFTKSGTVAALGVPYAAQGSLYVDNGATMTLSPGTQFIFIPGAYLYVAYNGDVGGLIAKGTAQAPIVMQGIDSTKGAWGGINFRNTTLGTSLLDHVQLASGGISGNGAIYLAKEIPVTNSTISGSAGYGIYYSKAFVTNYATTNTFSNDTQGSVGTF